MYVFYSQELPPWENQADGDTWSPPLSWWYPGNNHAGYRTQDKRNVPEYATLWLERGQDGLWLDV